MRYSSKDEAIRILRIASGANGATNAEIIMKASIPRTVLLERLWTMISDGLLEYDKEQQRYVTTESGKKFLTRLPLAADA